MGRPRKPVALHLIQNTFRPHRHTHLLPTAPEPAASPAEPEALSADADAWELTLELGTDFFGDLDDLTPAQIRRRARTKWREHGPALVTHWGPERARASWAWERWGEPE